MQIPDLLFFQKWPKKSDLFLFFSLSWFRKANQGCLITSWLGHSIQKCPGPRGGATVVGGGAEPPNNFFHIFEQTIFSLRFCLQLNQNEFQKIFIFPIKVLKKNLKKIVVNIFLALSQGRPALPCNPVNFSHFLEICSQSWIKWKINFTIFFFELWSILYLSNSG